MAIRQNGLIGNSRLSYFSSNVYLNSWLIQLHKVQTVWMAEKDPSRLLIFKNNRCWGRMAQWEEARTYFAGGRWGAGSNPGLATSNFFNPLGFLRFILTVDPVSFTRFLWKRISSKCLSLIVRFAVTVAIWPREVVSCRDFILRAVATFWAMSLFGIYPGRASCTEIPPLSYSGFQFTIIMKGRWDWLRPIYNSFKL